MTDTKPYPRRTIDSVIAALAGGISGIAFSLIAAAVINATTGNFTTVNTANLYATSTGSVASFNASSTAIGGGTRKTGEWQTSFSVNVDSLGAGQATTTNFSLTGIAANDHCSPVATAGDLGQSTLTIVMRAQATAANAGTIYYRNATGTASMDAGVSTLSVKCERYQ